MDDRSTDDGVKVAHTFDNLLPMRYFVTDESMDRGPGNARQLGLDNACGEWIGFMDADDLLAPDALRYVDKAVSQCEDAQMFIGNLLRENLLRVVMALFIKKILLGFMGMVFEENA